MAQTIDLLIHNIGQLCTMPTHDGAPQRGHDLGDLGMIENGAIAVHEGKVLALGSSADLLGAYDPETAINANGRLVTPGLVDPHTHAVWAGERAGEFERRIAGATYQEIMAEGGGINATREETQQASLERLVRESRGRLVRMMRNGATTIEVKSGYGLDTAAEIKMLDAIVALNEELPLDLVPTFLGAHAIPNEYRENSEAYVDVVVDEMLPAVLEWKAANWPNTLYCDVFCEVGAFSLEQTRRILETAQIAGLALKVHVDEFEALGGTRLGVQMGATSVDHLVATTDEEIALLGQSDTIAVSMPPTPFGLGHHDYTPAQKMLDANVALAIATDCNPGTAWNESMQFVMALATRYLRLTQAQSLAASTVNAAFAIGRGGEAGTLREGVKADIVLWNIRDYRFLGYRFGSNMVRSVFKNGLIVYQR
jgi:imidazolonepropionase